MSQHGRRLVAFTYRATDGPPLTPSGGGSITAAAGARRLSTSGATSRDRRAAETGNDACRATSRERGARVDRALDADWAGVASGRRDTAIRADCSELLLLVLQLLVDQATMA